MARKRRNVGEEGSKQPRQTFRTSCWQWTVETRRGGRGSGIARREETSKKREIWGLLRKDEPQVGDKHSTENGGRLFQKGAQERTGRTRRLEGTTAAKTAPTPGRTTAVCGKRKRTRARCVV